jgi:hypothetical protein
MYLFISGRASVAAMPTGDRGGYSRPACRFLLAVEVATFETRRLISRWRKK